VSDLRKLALQSIPGTLKSLIALQWLALTSYNNSEGLTL
jgi:hypothetical protein